jgi:hypothetical protein
MDNGNLRKKRGKEEEHCAIKGSINILRKE